MKHFMLKFNHGVEIGARLAYLGHYRRTGIERIKEIADDELEHREALKHVLWFYDQEPSKIIDFIFTVIGNMIYWLCQISPNFLLNFVARSLETFAVFSYGYLAIVYPSFWATFHKMANTEKEHEEFFRAPLTNSVKSRENFLENI